MDEQLENLLKELQKDTIRAFNSPNDEQAASQLNTILTRLKALLATEYDRGYNAAPDIEGEYIYLTEADWKRELKAEYDRGKVDGAKAYIEENYGPRCETKDTEDFPELKDGNGRCITCDQWENYDEWLKSKGEE